ncbi:ferritin light chain-like [Glossophaga mutica]
MQNLHSDCTLFQNMQKPSQGEWGDTQDTMEAAMVMEKNLNQALLDVSVLGCIYTDPHLSTFLANRFLDKEVKLMEKIGDHLTHLCRQAGPQVGLGVHVLEKLILKSN